MRFHLCLLLRSGDVFKRSRSHPVPANVFLVYSEGNLDVGPLCKSFQLLVLFNCPGQRLTASAGVGS